METKKIGEVNFKDFRTEFFLVKKIEDYLDKEKISPACLLPGGWLWYEATLFDLIDENEDGLPDEKFGNDFRVIYHGIIEKRRLRGNKVFEEGFTEKISYKKEELLTTGVQEVKSSGEKIHLIKYALLRNIAEKTEI